MVDSVTDATVTLSWMEPANNNGVITQYQLRFERCDRSNRVTLPVLNTLMHSVDGLVVNIEYCFRVRARTIVGPSAFSNEVRATICESYVLCKLSFDGVL